MSSVTKHSVLVLELQQTVYSVSELNDQEVCFDVLSGVLAFDIDNAVSLATQDGSATGN